MNRAGGGTFIPGGFEWPVTGAMCGQNHASVTANPTTIASIAAHASPYRTEAEDGRNR
jgi:hypothetical protein